MERSDDATLAKEQRAPSMARLREEEYSERERTRAIGGTIESFVASGSILCVALSGLAGTAFVVLVSLVVGLVAVLAALVAAAGCEPGRQGELPAGKRATLVLAVRWRLCAIVAYGAFAVAIGSSLVAAVASGETVSLAVLGSAALPVAARLIFLARGFRAARAAQIDLEAEG